MDSRISEVFASINDQSESQNSDASVYQKLWYCPYIHVEYHRLHENNLAQKRQLKWYVLAAKKNGGPEGCQLIMPPNERPTEPFFCLDLSKL
jgi:hypothetical protein